MKRLFFLFLAFFLSLLGKSQVDYKIEKYLDERGIDSFIVYTFQCSGFVSDSCQWDDPHYLIWLKNGNSYLKRFDYCKTFKTIPLDTMNLLKYYFQNKSAIDNEEIKIPTYYETRKIKNKVEEITITSPGNMSSHSCRHGFRLSREPEYKYAFPHDLSFKEFDNGRKNVFYNFNQNTKFKKLIDLTTTLLQTLEKEGRFEME